MSYLSIGLRTFQSITFVAISLIVATAPLINHIDDTDETYGYWEPLHYLLYSRGMQTWEYSPEFALRSYAFLFPLFAIATLFRNIFGLQDKVVFFYILRGCIGCLPAISQLTFFSALHYGIRTMNHYSVSLVEYYTILFLVSSPGIFFASTAFLPSAQAMMLLFLTLAATMRDRFLFAIFAGSIAVLWTGWPFVGLIFLPLGLYMLWKVTCSRGVFAAITFCLQAIVIVLITAAPAVLIDWFYYQRMTWPTLNILLYNTASKGDELYGTEPLSYYIKNLCLLTGLAFPLALLFPLTRTIRCLTVGAEKAVKGGLQLSLLNAIFCSMLLWLGVLASRPHKEERFLYPVYPLLILIAAHTAADCQQIAFCLFGAIESLGQFVQRALIFLLFLSSITLVIGRIQANHYNYGGYIHTWQDLSQSLTRSGETSNVCLGSDWYRFPSHFFLPSNAHLQYFEDRFHGILPQPFAEVNGTFAMPFLPMNDRNAEEVSRYVSIFDDCQVLVTSSAQMAKYNAILKTQGLTVQNIVGHEVLDKSSQRDGSMLQQIGRALRLPGLPPPPRDQYIAAKIVKVVKNVNEE